MSFQSIWVICGAIDTHIHTHTKTVFYIRTLKFTIGPVRAVIFAHFYRIQKSHLTFHRNQPDLTLSPQHWTHNAQQWHTPCISVLVCLYFTKYDKWQICYTLHLKCHLLVIAKCIFAMCRFIPPHLSFVARIAVVYAYLCAFRSISKLCSSDCGVHSNFMPIFCVQCFKIKPKNTRNGV